MSNKGHGQIKCINCGSTEINFDITKQKLVCLHCKSEFSSDKYDHDTNIDKLDGTIISDGAKDIGDNASDLVAIKCSSCGGEVLLNSSEVYQARCHWCRNTLSINNKLDNGSVPDMILPFSVTREEAVSLIRDFVKKKWFLASTKFKSDFREENIMGVYLPYMVVDVNSHIKLRNFDRLASHYFEDKKIYMRTGIYVYRDFDIQIDNLVIQSSEDKLNFKTKSKLNTTTMVYYGPLNILYKLTPFDVENSVKWNPNYLKGYSAERRDINVDEIDSLKRSKIKHITGERLDCKTNSSGSWDKSKLDLIGEKWTSAYLPVWIYSCKDKKGDTYYIAVNGRTKETIGNVPINKMLLKFLTLILGFGIIYSSILLSGVTIIIFSLFPALWCMLVFYHVVFEKFRGRATEWKENKIIMKTTEDKSDFSLTKTKISNLIKKDRFINYMIYVDEDNYIDKIVIADENHKVLLQIDLNGKIEYVEHDFNILEVIKKYAPNHELTKYFFEEGF